MRPIRLEMEGFATFRERTVLSFDDLDLVAFVGATGAGKSTIIDAMTFALYGSVARYDNANVVAPVIHQLSTEAKIRFDFELANQHYVAVRVVRRRGSRSKAADSATGSTRSGSTRSQSTGSGATPSGATTKEARLERMVGGESTEVLAGNVRELDAAVVALLGLDFGQFTRTVVLPQGQFAQFLKDEPSSRQKLLRSLLDLDVYHRMGVVARDEAKKAGLQAEALESELNRQAAVSVDELKSLAVKVDALTVLRETVIGRLEDLEGIDGELNPVREQVNEIDGQLQRLKLINVPGQLAEADRLLSEADTAVAEQESDLAEARAVWEKEQAAVQAGPDKAELQTTLNQIGQLTSITSDQAVITSTISELNNQVEVASTDQTARESEAAKAQETLARLRRSADAEVWLEQLEAGQPCPVCRQTVDHVPDHSPSGALAEAEAHAKTAAKAAADQARQLSEARGSLQAATGQQEKLAATAKQLSSVVGKRQRTDLEVSLAEIDKRTDAVKRAFDQLTQLEKQLAKIKANRDELSRRTQQWNAEFMQQRDQISALEPPPPLQQSLLEDWSALASWAVEQQSDLESTRASRAEKGKQLAERRRELLAVLGEQVEPHGIGAEPGTMLEAVAVARSQASSQLETAQTRHDDRKRLQAKVDELMVDRELNRVLGQHLAASGFEGWLLNEALDNIVNRATGWLRDLSGGSYSLAVNNREFAIIDHNNADEQRDVRTLSGGETFLTSLSLALALADSIAELAPVDAPRLQSMFLDEGFGTLDGATLDVVASAIEELASTGRMIGIVTHVRDLAERLPARFEVSKSTAGSSVELVHP